MNATEFEKRVEQISALLKELDAEVVWNDKVPDPDNPTQSRQIDVSVRRGDDLTLIECRHRGRVQDVQWIEELYGRKASLRASQVIGVSSSGFTTGAVKKAKSLGVFIRKLSEVSDEEVKLWGARASVTLTYAVPTEVKIYFISTHRIQVQLNEKLIRRAFRGISLGRLLAIAIRDAPRTGLGQGPIVCRVQDPPGIFLGSVPISELFIYFVWHAVERQQVLPIIMSYGDVDESSVESIANLEASPHSRTAVAYSKGQVSVMIDVSVMSFAPNSVLTGARVDFTKPVSPRMSGMIGFKEEVIQNLPTEFAAVARDSDDYNWLVRSSTGPNIWQREIPD